MSSTDDHLEIFEAITTNDLNRLQRFYESGKPWHPDTSLIAVRNQNVEFLRYVHEHFYEHKSVWHSRTTLDAAYNNNTACIIYAYENGCPLYPQVLRYMIQYDNIECLEYAYENIPWEQADWGDPLIWECAVTFDFRKIGQIPDKTP